ncbi:hypothetical protein D3C73_1369260 [compost metagenome]
MVDGLDNSAPTITLNSSIVAITQNKNDYNPHVDLGGYTVSDNISEASNLKVSVSDLDLSKLGKQTAIYTVTDEVGNSVSVKQEVVVLSNTGLLILGNDQVISSVLGSNVLFNRNDITFKISR